MLRAEDEEQVMVTLSVRSEVSSTLLPQRTAEVHTILHLDCDSRRQGLLLCHLCGLLSFLFEKKRTLTVAVLT